MAFLPCNWTFTITRSAWIFIYAILAWQLVFMAFVKISSERVLWVVVV